MLERANIRKVGKSYQQVVNPSSFRPYLLRFSPVSVNQFFLSPSSSNGRWTIMQQLVDDLLTVGA